MNSFDVAIIGGGLIGTSIAFELAAEGLRVVVLDRQQPGREASWAAAGMLSPAPETPRDLPLAPLSNRSLQIYPEFIAAIEEHSGMLTSFRSTGAIEVFGSAADSSERDAVLAERKRLGLAATAISPEDVRKLEPTIGLASLSALWLPEEATVEPRLLIRAALSAAFSRGVTVQENRRVTSFLFDPKTEHEGRCHAASQCVGLVADGEKIWAPHVIVAAGCFSAEIASIEASAPARPVSLSSQILAQYAPVKPIRGQLLAIRSKNVTLQRILRSHKGYLVPRPDGRIIAGSTLEDVGFEKQITVAGMRKIMDGAVDLVPALSDAEILETWAGLRPGTPDDLPIIGLAGIEGLIFATGHYRNGILLAPVTAKLVKDFVTREKPAIDPTPFSPLRFASRAVQARSAS